MPTIDEEIHNEISIAELNKQSENTDGDTCPIKNDVKDKSKNRNLLEKNELKGKKVGRIKMKTEGVKDADLNDGQIDG